MNCLELKYRKNKRKGKQVVRFEIAHSGLSEKRWYAHTPVEVEPPLHQPKGEKKERRTTDRSSVQPRVGSPQGTCGMRKHRACSPPKTKRKGWCGSR